MTKYTVYTRPYNIGMGYRRFKVNVEAESRAKAIDAACGEPEAVFNQMPSESGANRGKDGNLGQGFIVWSGISEAIALTDEEIQKLKESGSLLI